jgi:16S rRNA processing protein RimM
VRGEASVELWTDSIDRFSEVSRITLVAPGDSSTREATIESARAHGDRALVKFTGIDSVEDLRNWTIEILDEEARKLDEDEYFLHDLVGMKLVDEGGAEKGIVTDAYAGGGGTLLEVTRGKRKYEVPFATDICTKIDRDAKTIVVKLPEGLDNLS